MALRVCVLAACVAVASAVSSCGMCTGIVNSQAMQSNRRFDCKAWFAPTVNCSLPSFKEHADCAGVVPVGSNATNGTEATNGTNATAAAQDSFLSPSVLSRVSADRERKLAERKEETRVVLLQLGMLQNRDGKSASMKFDRLRDATKKLAQMTSCENMAASLRTCNAVAKECLAASGPTDKCDSGYLCSACSYFDKPFCAHTNVVSDPWTEYNVSPEQHRQMTRLAVHALPRSGALKKKGAGKTGTRMKGRGMPADWSKDRYFQASSVPETIEESTDSQQ